MKLTIFLLFGFLFSASASSYSQSTRLDIKLKNGTIAELIKYVENNSEFVFLYKDEDLDLRKKITVNLEEATIDQVLSTAFNEQNLEWDVYDRQVVLRKNISLGDRQQSTQQQRTITGTVTDQRGEPLPGVTVMVAGTTIGTVTNDEGNFTLTIPVDSETLQFSFVGMRTQEVSVDGRTTFTVVMAIDAIGIEEVVAVGYGTIQRQHLTGAVGSVNLGDESVSRPVTDFGQALYGRIAGVEVITATGRPGESSAIQIRGMNSISAGTTPLLVVDGMAMPEWDLSFLNSTDIESIDILKDAASAAIYGSRGSNGVILVTTKSGKAGKPTLSVNYTYSSQQLIRKLPMMNSAEYAEAMIDWSQNGWIDIGGDPNAPNTIEARGNYKYTWHPSLENPETLPDTDWQDLAYGVAPMHKADLSYLGGNEDTKYYLSAGIVDQRGIFTYYDNGYTRFNLNIKIDSKINDWLKVGGLLTNSYSDEQDIPRFLRSYTYEYPPIFPNIAENGYWGGTGTVPGFENYNRIYFRERGHPFSRPTEDRLTKSFNTNGNLFAEILIFPGLQFKTSVLANFKRVDNFDYRGVDRMLGPGTEEIGEAISVMSRTMSYTTENLLNYEYINDGHNFNALIGSELYQLDYYQVNAVRRNYDDDLIRYLSAGNQIYDASDNAYSSGLLSIFSRINYQYNGKYMASATFRRDGSSRFGPDNKWGNFPSVSVGWRVSDENFMINSSSISNLKLRASYGLTGNNNFTDYRWISRMNRAKVAFGNHLTNSFYPSSVENPDLGWERTQTMNIGIELGVMKNRILLVADLYKSKSDNLLLEVPIPSTSGFTSVFSNIGELENRGLEISLITHNLNTNLIWTSQFNFSANRNKVTKLGVDDAPMLMGTYTFMDRLNTVGEPIFNFYGYVYEGAFLNQSEIDAAPSYPYDVKPGMGKYKDVNNDGKIDPDDRTIIGNNQPDFSFSVNNEFRYNNFDFSFLWNGVVGNDVYDAQNRRSMVGNQEGRNFYKMKIDRWRSEADPGDGYHHKLTTEIKGFDIQQSSYRVYDGTYFRLKDVTLGYSIPAEIAQKVGLANTRVFFNGVNLITFQKSHLIDPENYGATNTEVVDASTRGISHAPYPTAKIISFGINVEF